MWGEEGDSGRRSEQEGGDGGWDGSKKDEGDEEEGGWGE